MQAHQAVSARLALREAIEYSAGDSRHKQRQRNFANQFAEFLEGALPADDIRQTRNSHVKRYIERRLELGHSPNTIRQAVNPVRLLNNYMTDEVDPDWRPLEVSRYLRDLAPRQAPDQTYLTFEQLVHCIHLAETNDKPAALLVFAVCGLTGMRISELERRTRNDLVGDVLTIAGETKNQSSRRVIPVCSLTRRVFEEHFDMFGGGGRWGGQGTMYAYKTFWTQTSWVLQHATATTGNPRFVACCPKDAARKTFENYVKEFCSDREILDAYTGRAPQSVRQRNYANRFARPTQLPEINDSRIEVLRKAIVEPLEKKLQAVSDLG